METLRRRQITLQIPEELYEKIKQESERKGMQLNEVVSIILYHYFFENADRE